MINLFEKAVISSKELTKVVPNKINRVLGEIADQLIEQSDKIISANRLDLKKITEENLLYELICLDKEMVNSMAEELREVASLPAPIGRILESDKRPNQMIISKVSAPYGVIGVIYESRPHFTLDSFALCFKSCNAVVLKSTFEADYTNNAIVKLIKEVLDENIIDTNIITLLSPDQESAIAMLQAENYIDLAIPRGSQSLVEFVHNNAKIPYIKTGRGVNHTYIDKEADIAKAAAIAHNAKTFFPQSSNSLDCLIIHKKLLRSLTKICQPLILSKVTIYADAESYDTLVKEYPQLVKPAEEKHYSTEFMDYQLVIKTVESTEEALEHIEKYTSQNSEAIVTENEKTAKQFFSGVDAACIYHNVSTAFTDGSEFGMGAKIGISTQKFGARGPLGIRDLTTYKYIITGQSQIRE